MFVNMFKKQVEVQIGITCGKTDTDLKIIF